MKINYLLIKKLIGKIAAAVGLLLISPFLLLVGIIIRLESKGPVIYKSKRVGQNYQIFDLLKFRTMAINSDQNIEAMKSLNQYADNSKADLQNITECPFCKILKRPCSPVLHNDEGKICENLHFLKKERSSAFFKIKDDPRVTRFGKFLRKTSIDELPQLINVVKGDMAIIGNRPLPLYEAEKLTYDSAIERFNSPAGLTGLWQITKRGNREISATERIELDKEYSKSISLSTDIKILFKTFPALFQKENA